MGVKERGPGASIHPSVSTCGLRALAAAFLLQFWPQNRRGKLLFWLDLWEGSL